MNHNGNNKTKIKCSDVGDVSNQKKFIIFDKYAKFLIIFIFVILIAYLIGLCLTQIPSFDGAMNLQISENLAEKGIYATRYNGDTWFDERIQTGAPVLIIISFIIKIFGKNMPLILSVNAFFILGLFFIIRKILKKCDISDLFVSILFLFLFLNPVLFNSGMGVYGEIPTLFFFLVSSFLLLDYEKSKLKIFLSGVFLGLAYLTKTVILISFPAFIIVFILNLYFKKLKVKDFIIWFSGFLSFILIFEIYKYFSLGSENYFLWWYSQLQSILRQAGVKEGFSDTANKFVKIFLHIKKYCGYFKINIILFISVVIFNTVVFVRKFIDEFISKNFKFDNVIFITAASYMVWWIAITPTEKAWDRRIINGSILLLVSTLMLFVYFIRRYWSKISKLKFLNLYIVIFGLFIVINLYFNIDNISWFDNSNKVAAYKVADYIKDIKKKDPNALFCGMGWGQAPVASFLADEQFYDFGYIDDINTNTYVVLDNWAFTVTKDSVYNTLGETDYEEVYNDVNNFRIYKVNALIAPFTEEDYRLADRSSYVYTDTYEYTSNLYNYEQTSNLRWSKKDSAILLKNNNNAKSLFIKFKVPALNRFINKDLNMDIFIDDILVEKIKIDHEGVYEVNINIDNMIEINDVAEIKFKMSSRISTPGDSRKLSFMFEEASLRN